MVSIINHWYRSALQLDLANDFIVKDHVYQHILFFGRHIILDSDYLDIPHPGYKSITIFELISFLNRNRSSDQVCEPEHSIYIIVFFVEVFNFHYDPAQVALQIAINFEADSLEILKEVT